MGRHAAPEQAFPDPFSAPAPQAKAPHGILTTPSFDAMALTAPKPAAPKPAPPKRRREPVQRPAPEPLQRELASEDDSTLAKALGIVLILAAILGAVLLASVVAIIAAVVVLSLGVAIFHVAASGAEPGF